MSNKKLIDDYINYNLSEDALDKLASDKESLQQIDVAILSDKLSKEFFNPGYEAFMDEKKEGFRQLIAEDAQVNSSDTQSGKSSKSSSGIKLLGVLLAIILLSGAAYFLSTNGTEEKPITIEEVKQYAMLSYESTGALNANRGESQSPNQLSENYELLRNGNCNDLTINGKYIEQELWSQLYCAYLNDDAKMIDYYKSQIIDKKYFNYTKLN